MASTPNQGTPSETLAAKLTNAVGLAASAPGPSTPGANAPGPSALGAGVLGVGVDLVDIASFEELIETPGSKFLQPDAVFTARELRRARLRALEKGDQESVHLAALWAIKESVVKAWVGALSTLGSQPPLEPTDVVWAEIQVVHDASGAPRVQLHGRLQELFLDSELRNASWHVSATHDGPVAAGVAMLSR